MENPECGEGTEYSLKFEVRVSVGLKNKVGKVIFPKPSHLWDVRVSAGIELPVSQPDHDIGAHNCIADH